MWKRASALHAVRLLSYPSPKREPMEKTPTRPRQKRDEGRVGVLSQKGEIMKIFKGQGTADLGKPWRYEEDGLTVTRGCAWSPPGCHPVGCGIKTYVNEQGELVKIEGEPTMREDMVRVGMGTADLRYRGEFREWSTTFMIRYNANVLSVEQHVNLFNTAGFAIDVGEWRPQKDGSYGMFRVA